MRPLVALLGFASLGACLTTVDVDSERLMPTWEEFDDYLHAQGQTNNRFKRDFPFEYFNEGRSAASSNGLAATLDALDATVDRQGLVANAIDSVGDRLRQKDYIGAISNFANKLRGSPGRPRQDLLFNIPQTSVPQIIVDLAAVSLNMHCFYSARIWSQKRKGLKMDSILLRFQFPKIRLDIISTQKIFQCHPSSKVNFH